MDHLPYMIGYSILYAMPKGKEYGHIENLGPYFGKCDSEV